MRYIARSNGLRPAAEASCITEPRSRRKNHSLRSARIARGRRTLSLWIGILALAVGMSTSGTAKASEFAYLAYANSFESLAVANEDGEHPRILLSESSTFYWGGGSAIALSPDGRYVAFCANETDKVTGYHLYMYFRDINTNTPKWKIPVSGSCESFDFSPDGRHLLYSGGEADIDIRELTLDGNYQPISNRAVISWGGDQINARYAPDGKHIVFSSDANSEGQLFGEEWPYEFHLFKTDLEGNEPTNLTQEFGAFYSTNPDVHLNGQAIVFNCGFGNPKTGLVWSICRIGMDGTGATDLGVKGWDPQWTADGSAIVYNVENGAAREIWEMDPSGEDQHVLPLDELPGPIGYGVNSVAARQTSTGDDALARIFSPAMRFDEGERWKPLELDKMFEEIPPRVCIKKKCSQIFDPGELASKSGSKPASAVLDIPPVEGEWDTKPHVSDADNYGALDCTSLEGQGTDCEDPEHSAIYYDTSHVSPGGYQYLEYWFFYRFNDSPLDTNPLNGELLDHEADWENVSVGIPYGIPVTTFDFVTFAQHGSSYAYLRENLTCEEGSECGFASSKHVDVYVAGGTHASYGEPCSGLVPCVQADGTTPETDHGGEVNWVNNGDAAALRRLPQTYAGSWLEGPHGFTDWPGMWGFDAKFNSHVASPANGANEDQFDTPWLAECFYLACDRDEGQGLRSMSDPSEGPVVAGGMPDECEAWFGSGVSAVLCSQPRLRNSIAEGAIGSREGSADLVENAHSRGERAAAATGGLVQMEGSPLKPDDELSISGDIGRDAVLLIRAEAGGTLTDAKFSLRGHSAGTSARIVRRVTGGDVGAVPVVVLGNGERLEPSSIRTVTPR